MNQILDNEALWLILAAWGGSCGAYAGCRCAAVVDELLRDERLDLLIGASAGAAAGAALGALLSGIAGATCGFLAGGLAGSAGGLLGGQLATAGLRGFLARLEDSLL